ncbi:TonB-dependent receptor [Weeksellaceae bacterium TAE3-ERU29]|nr:TonB-dependent receptor [Weeksellaceae bacterium TAE3-ERU29]
MRKIYLLFTVLIIISFVKSYAQENKYTISGYITEEGSKESIIGANIYFPEIDKETTSNNYGYYAMSLPEGTYHLICSYVGFQDFEKEVKLDKNLVLNISLSNSIKLSEVVATAENSIRQSKTSRMSEVKIPITQIKQLPGLLGEKDVLKALQLTPGVQSGSEGNSGLYVRGGGPDQNLLILDDAPVYNASHLFGFFSIFNGDAIKNVTLTKGGFPARYGGRLSSVLDMSMKDGNKEKFAGEVGIGLISSRLTLEAPIIKNKSSFIISGRRTYVDLIARPLMDSDEKVGYYFYDLNAKINYEIDQNNKLYLSGYFGKDKFNSTFKTDYSETKGALLWGNATGTIRWNRLFGNHIFSNTSLIFSDYNFQISNTDKHKENSNNTDKYIFYESKYKSSISDLGLKYDMQFSLMPNYTLRTGLASTIHNFSPSAITTKNESASLSNYENSVEKIKTIESGIYAENELKFLDKIRMNVGLRFSHYHHEEKTYMGLEPRFSVGYSLSDDMAIKGSYASMYQYVHLLTSSGISLPMDLWVPTTNIIKPQHSQQVAIGFTKDWIERKIAFSIEGYYKKMNSIIGYAPGANFLLNSTDPSNASQDYSWEENIIQGQGWSYGVELFAHKKVGKLSGWLGYTLSWTQHQFDEDNGGEKYFARYDRRHDFSFVGIYNITDNITLSGTWVYGTGNAISLPNATYISENDPIGDFHQNIYSYGKKNDFRMRAYHRLDLAIQFNKITKRNNKRTWEIGLYNAYSRKNPFFYQIVEKERQRADGTFYRENVLTQYSVFPIIPSISYTLKF